MYLFSCSTISLHDDILCHLCCIIIILFSFCLCPPYLFPLSYLCVCLSEQNSHALHREAGVAQRTGVAAVARGSVHTLHASKAGVKLALQEGGRT